MKFYFLCLLFCSFNDVLSQKDLVVTQSFRAKGDFVEQVTNAVNKWHKQNKSNNLYLKNVDLNPKLITGDSILYELLFVTKSKGELLWKGNGKFIKSGNNIIGEVSHLTALKPLSIKGTDDLNSDKNKLDGITLNNEKNGEKIKKEVKQFFKAILK